MIELHKLLSNAAILNSRVFSTATLPTIAHIAEDSRRVEPGSLFVAVRGKTTDGHRFIAQAIAQGAVAVAGTREERPDELPDDVPYIHVPNDRQAVALL